MTAAVRESPTANRPSGWEDLHAGPAQRASQGGHHDGGPAAAHHLGVMRGLAREGVGHAGVGRPGVAARCL